MEQTSLQPETLRLIAGDPRLAELSRQATVNYQVADLLDVRALGAESPEQAAACRLRAIDRRKLGDRLMGDLMDELRTSTDPAHRAERPARR